MRLADAVRPRGNFISDGSGVCGTGIPFASCMQTAVMTMIWYCVLQRGKSWVICSDVDSLFCNMMKMFHVKHFAELF